MNRSIANSIIGAAFLVLGHSALLAQTRIEVSSRLLGYDLQQTLGESSTETTLPRIVVSSGSQGTVELTKPHRYPQQARHLIRMTVYRTADIGIRFPIYVREKDPTTVSFLVRVELCEREDPTEPLSTVIKTTTSYWGERAFDKPFTIDLRAPRGKAARLELTFTKR